MKHFAPLNKNGNVEISVEELNRMLEETYAEGYAKGKSDQILKSAPSFAIDDRKSKKDKKIFSENGKILIFRATII